jgi:hypothetical protein
MVVSLMDGNILAAQALQFVVVADHHHRVLPCRGGHLSPFSTKIHGLRGGGIHRHQKEDS